MILLNKFLKFLILQPQLQNLDEIKNNIKNGGLIFMKNELLPSDYKDTLELII